ncbi:OadG family protein [Acetivibrio cellulolyticus]|uniref:OadG family protein n=1 Tax=Acetivibrio cellulolyticus TaxID=35830 RepID=UPI0001E2E335|nr:OadG family protein [Acetivibrio cellulolyticus]
MSIIQSLIVSLFCIALVFLVLSFLFFIVKLFSVVLKSFSGKKNETVVQSVERAETSYSVLESDENAFSSGELKLYNVDEKTAAMIMAIVSDESKIPLSELSFKSIRALE